MRAVLGDPGLPVPPKESSLFLPETRLSAPETASARAAHAEAVRRFRARQDAGSKIVAADANV